MCPCLRPAEFVHALRSGSYRERAVLLPAEATDAALELIVESRRLTHHGSECWHDTCRALASEAIHAPPPPPPPPLPLARSCATTLLCHVHCGEGRTRLTDDASGMPCAARSYLRAFQHDYVFGAAACQVKRNPCTDGTASDNGKRSLCRKVDRAGPHASS